MEEQQSQTTEPQTQKEDIVQESQEGQLLKKVDSTSHSNFLPKLAIIAVAVLIIVGGVATGYTLSPKGSGSVSLEGLEVEEGKPPPPQKDIKTFRDSAEGVVERIEDRDVYTQGTHLLIREGADSANLTSSVVDLDQYVGKKVVIWGETFGSDQVGWLMDVGRVEEK